jgi:capsular polysaccharide biosynthesis protein
LGLNRTEDRVELSRYVALLWKRGWIIVLVMVVAAVSAYGFSRVQTPIYRASIQISINPARPDWGLAQTAKTMLRNYTINMTTHTWAQRVVDELKLDVATAFLLSRVKTSSDESNLTIQIDVNHEDPKVAQDIAWKWANLFVEWRTAENLDLQKTDRVGAAILDAPNVSLYSPKTKINVIAAGVVGLLLGGLVVFFLEWIESDVIRSVKDVERYIGVTVLGTIPPFTGGQPSAVRSQSASNATPPAGLPLKRS